MLPQPIVIAVLTAITLAASLSRRALDLGSCSDPTIKFANDLDGRKEAAFAPNNAADFNHGSAQKIGIIASFICGQLQSACKASQDAVDACNAGEQAAASLTGQAAADAFNKAVTGGATPVASGTADAPVASETTVNSSGNDCPSTVTVIVGAPVATSTSTSSSSSSSANLQTFTGNLGGAPPPVTAGGKGFVTNGSDFLNLAAALGRSCDVQHNACANAANSGSGSFSVSDCDTQDTACKAAAK